MSYLLISFGLFLGFLLADKALDMWGGKINLDSTYKVQQLQAQTELLKQDSNQHRKIEGFGKYSNSQPEEPDIEEVEIPEEEPESE